jgi:hypothetical protein
MKTLIIFAIAATLALLIPALVMAQSPPVPDKSPGIPSKTTPLASPQVQASPQAAYDAVPLAPLVLRAPQIYQVQRQVLLAPVAYAAADPCVAQQVVVQRQIVQHSAAVSHGVVHQAQINHGLVGAGVGRQPRKIVTKQVTKTKRGLFGGLFGR